MASNKDGNDTKEDGETRKCAIKEGETSRLTTSPPKPFLEKHHYDHPKLGAKQTVNQQHNPEIIRAK